MQSRDVIIIGGGPAGRVIVHTLHSQNSGRSVTLIKDEEINVNRTYAFAARDAMANGKSV